MDTAPIIYLIEGICIGFIASIPLGPIGVLCIQRTIHRGKRAGFASGLGAATSDFIYALIACFSISMVTNFISEHEKILSILGALVLIGLGLKIFFTNPTPQMKQPQHKRNTALLQDYLSTLLLTITNPLAIFLFIAAFSIVGTIDNIYTQILLLIGVFAGASTWWFILTMLVGIFRKRLMSNLYYLNRIAGAIIIALVVIGLVVEFIKRIVA